MKSEPVVKPALDGDVAPRRAASNYRPGAILALLLLCLYGGLAISVDFPRAALGFQSDEATYYMLAVRSLSSRRALPAGNRSWRQ